MLNKLAEQQLRKAGWYPGRKIDIRDQIDFLKGNGYQIFDAGVKFLEEYGKLHIVDRYISTFDNSLTECHHTTFVNEILECYSEYSEYEKFEFNLFGQSKEKILPVIMFEDSDPIYIFISEFGNFYCDSGLWADTVDVLWNEWYHWGVEEPHGIVLNWNEYYAGEKRKFIPAANKISRKYL